MDSLDEPNLDGKSNASNKPEFELAERPGIFDVLSLYRDT